VNPKEAAMAWLERDPAGEAPLAGVRVLDFSELLPGPFMTQSMAELGADVLKIERPPHGDNLRRMAPSLFDAVNRGKRSLCLDLKDAAQRERALALAGQADVLVEGWRPGVMHRLGLGPDALLARNPRLVYVSLTGYGATGPKALLPGHDLNYLAAAGVVSLAATEAQPSPVSGVPLADLCASLYAFGAVNAALLQRERSGRGQHLDVAITDCALHWMNPRLAAFRQAGANDLPAQREIVQSRPGYGMFRCRDGGWISLGALEDHFWGALVQALGLADYAGEAWRGYACRARAAREINDAIAQAVARLAQADLMERLTAADVPVAAMAAPADLPADEQFQARGLFTPTAAGPLCRFPVAMHGTPAAPARSPALGPFSH
jgi:crotonobetainyl-CoA:carnitine CoA-transferase CaiB-like acyl-CoA transferase